MKKILILTALILALPAQAELYKAKFGLSNLTITATPACTNGKSRPRSSAGS